MTNNVISFAHLSNEDLVAEIARLAAAERHATARLIASLMELDARRLYLGAGCSSLFTYCVEVLGLSEHAAYGRIEAARAARRFPVILELLADGSVTLTTVCLLGSQLTPENHLAVLDSARRKSKRDVERLVAELRPLPAVPSSIRKLPAPPARSVGSTSKPPIEAPPAPGPAAVNVYSKRPAVVTPLAPAIYQLRVTLPQETHDKLRRVQDLLRHTIPNGDPAVILDRALTVLLSQIEKSKLASTERPRAAKARVPGSRHIPAATRRKVWLRDDHQCAFVGRDGRRCADRGFLEIHHIIPFAAGGSSEIANLSLRCRAHNAHEAELYFGPSQPWLVRETNATDYFGPTNPGREKESEIAESAARKSLKTRVRFWRFPILSHVPGPDRVN